MRKLPEAGLEEGWPATGAKLVKYIKNHGVVTEVDAALSCNLFHQLTATYMISLQSHISLLSLPLTFSPPHTLFLSLCLSPIPTHSLSLSLSLPYTHSLSFLYLFSPHVTNEGVVSQAKDIAIVLVGCSWDP